MIGYLQGKIVSKNFDQHQCTLLTGGVGYEVTLPTKFFEALVLESELMLWIHTHAREDILMLYGFQSEMEKQFFRVLLGVSGLGPKTALSLLSEHGAEKLSQYVMAKDADEISSAPGIGKKLAQRLVLELSGKLEKFAWVTQFEKMSDSHRKAVASPSRQLKDDLNSALSNLGYLPQPIKTVLDRILTKEMETTSKPSFEICLRTALKELSGRPRVVTTEASGNG